MYTPELLRQLYAHMEWADARVWSEVLGTEGARGDPWLRDKLFHMHDTQQAFLGLWTGQPRQTPGDLGSLAAVCEWARLYYATARGFLEASDAPALAEPASDAFGDRMRQHFGPPRGNVTLGVTALQVAAHTTHHRGQIMTRLRELDGARRSWTTLSGCGGGAPPSHGTGRRGSPREDGMTAKISVDESCDRLDEAWRPRVIATLNGQEVKLIRVKGVCPWHRHDDADEFFLVWKGRFSVEFRDRRVTMKEGECVLVPRGVEHRTSAAADAYVLCFEPAGTVNTGNLPANEFTAPCGVPIC